MGFDRRLRAKCSRFFVKNDVKYLDDAGFALLDSLLTINPNKRCSASQALKSEWFGSAPFPSPPRLGAIEPSHDYEQRQLRKNPNYKNQSQRRYQYSYNKERDRSRSRERKKANSVSLPPPIQRRPSIHQYGNVNAPKPKVVTLQAPSLKTKNSNGNGGYRKEYNPEQPHTFYSRFKKPDQLKNRSRF